MRRLHRFVRRAARILGREEKTSSEVKAAFETLLEKIRSRLERPRLSPEEAKALGKMLKTAEYYGDRLFTCYDHPGIPPTNNGHEQMYGRLRGAERRVTGHRSTSRTVRDGRFTAPLIERLLRGRIPTSEELSRGSPERYKENLDEMRRARRRHARPRQIRKHFEESLGELTGRTATRRRRRAGKLDTRVLRC